MGIICPPGWDRVNVSENLGKAAVLPAIIDHLIWQIVYNFNHGWLLKVAFCKKVWCGSNILPNHYPVQNIWFSCPKHYTNYSNVLLRIEIWHIFWVAMNFLTKATVSNLIILWIKLNWSWIIKAVTQLHFGSIWYQLEPSEVLYSTNQVLVENFFVSMVFWRDSS